MKVVKTKRQGKVINTTVIGTSRLKKAKLTIEARAEMPAIRKNLTKAQWVEATTLRRGILRLVPEYYGLDELSLNDLRETREGIRRCDMARIMAQGM